MRNDVRRIRVVINGVHAKSGGGVTYLRNILVPLADDDRLDLHLFLHADQGPLFAGIDGRVKLHLFDVRPGFLRLLIWEQIMIPRRARALGAEVTFSPANYGPLLAPAPVLLLRNALAVFGREDRLAKRLYWLGLAAMTAICLLGCRRAIAVSDYARRALALGLGGRTARKVSVVHHGVAERFHPRAAALDGPPFLLAVGDVYIQKNLHTLIAAMPAIRERAPDVTLKIAGRPIDPDYHARLRAAIDALGLGEAVAFLGECGVERLVGLYQDCAVFVFPSTVETFGHPLIEAMASGAPVACSCTAAMPEVAGAAALYFDPMDPIDMAAKITALLADRALARHLASRGRARAAQFSWREAARKTAEILVEAARGPAPATREQPARAIRDAGA